MDFKHIIISALLLGLFAIFGTGLLSIVEVNTKDRIAEQERKALLRNLNEVISPDHYDNDLANSIKMINAPEAMGTSESTTVYIAALDNQPIAAIFSAIAPDGYSGKNQTLNWNL